MHGEIRREATVCTGRSRSAGTGEPKDWVIRCPATHYLGCHPSICPCPPCHLRELLLTVRTGSWVPATCDVLLYYPRQCTNDRDRFHFSLNDGLSSTDDFNNAISGVQNFMADNCEAFNCLNYTNIEPSLRNKAAGVCACVPHNGGTVCARCMCMFLMFHINCFAGSLGHSSSEDGTDHCIS